MLWRNAVAWQVPAFSLLALMAAPGPLHAGTNVWTGHGPGGGNIQALAVDPKNPGTLYISAGTSGVYKSTDGGASWNPTGSGLPASASRLAVDPANPNTVYALTNQLFKSTDGGQTWSAPLLPDYVGSLALDPQNPGTLYVGGGNGVFKSTDGGASWSVANSGLTGVGVGPLAVSPHDSATIYAGAYSRATVNLGPVFRSTDGGATWVSPLQQKFLALDLPGTNTCDTWNYYYTSITGYDAPPADQLSCYPADNREAEVTLNQYLTALENYGRRPFSSNYGLLGNVLALLVDPRDSSKVYALTNTGIFLSTDGALSWNDANAGLNTRAVNVTNAIAMDPAHPDTLYAALYGGRVFKSMDGGQSWNPASTLAFINGVSGGINVLAVDPQNSGTIYAGSSFGLFQSTDSASSWTSRDSGLADASVRSLLVTPQSPGTVYAAVNNAVFRTTDGGITWLENDFPNAPLAGSFVLLAVDPQNPAVLYGSGIAAGPCCNPPQPALLKSTDGGATWHTTGLQQAPNFLVIDPRNSGTLYARSGLAGGGIIKSTDGGVTWNPVNSGLGGTPNNTLNIVSLSLDPQNPDTLYCIRYTDGQLFRSADGAASWMQVNTGWDTTLFHAAFLTADPQNSGTLYAGTVEFDCGYGDTCPSNYYDKVNATPGPGIFKSTDGGQSWLRLNTPPIKQGYFGFGMLAVDPRNPNALYAVADYPSLFVRSTDGGASWNVVNAGLPFTQINGLAVDGRNPGTVYAATAGSGVLSITFDSQ